MFRRSPMFPALAVAAALIAACGSDEETESDAGTDTTSDAADTSDAATDTEGSGDATDTDLTDVSDTDPSLLDSVTFRLTNTNTMNPVWVQTIGLSGNPTWYGLQDSGTDLRIFGACGPCACGETDCPVCDLAPPATLELAPGDDVTATWD
ncbi:MAG: hypothetical protein KDA28_11480, partial [Phycisphaerales bacterium]|nr:hypothetical protein [Phycisphaerales bacterium]